MSTADGAGPAGGAAGPSASPTDPGASPAGRAAVRPALRPERAHRRPVVLGLVLALAGVLAVALGITAATVWTVPSTTTSVAALGDAAGAGGPVSAAVGVPGLLEARDGPVVVEATGEGEVALGTGSEEDVAAWLDADPAVPAARLTGFDPETAAVVVEAPEVPEAGADAGADAGSDQGAGTAAAPGAGGSDLWTQEAAGEGRAELTPDPAPEQGAGSAVLVATSTGALSSVSLTWPVQVAHPAALILLVAGGLLLLAGLALLAAARRGVGGPRLPRRPRPAAQGAPAPADGPRRGRRAAGPPSPTGGDRPVRALSAAAPPLLVALVSLPVLAGCAADPLQPRPQPVPEPRPAVTPGQLARIVDGPAGVAATVTAADAALDPAAAGARLDGAALQERQADYAVTTALVAADPAAQGPVLAPHAGERLVEAVPAAGPWPRFLLTVSTPAAPGAPEAAEGAEGDDGGGGAEGGGDAAGVLPDAPPAVPVLEVLAQADPRAPYKVVAAAGLLPGATFPQLTQTGGTVEVVDPTGEDLLLPPVDALARYADVLTAGTGSAHAAEFTQDAFTGSVLAEQGAEAAAGAQYLTRTSTHTPREGAVWSLRTADGGAVVVGVLDATRTFAATVPGVSLTLPPDVAALGGRPSASTGSITAVETVVLTVPPAGDPAADPEADPAAAAQVAVVGGRRGFTTVTLS